MIFCRVGLLRLPAIVPNTMAITTLRPQSGIQLVMILGVVLMVTTTAPELGVKMLILAIGMWLVYNLFNIGRQP